MHLNEKIINFSRKFKTPFMLVDLKQLRNNYLRVQKSINGVEVFYAIKANDHSKILETLHQEGCSFEISSNNEFKALKKLKVPGEKIMCFNSIKSPEFLQAMVKYGVFVMAYDSTEELDKIAKYAPKSKLVLRIIVDNIGSEWPLTKKFGVDAAEALPLIKYAQKKGLETIGLTFHVGSQCLNKNNWASALYVCDDIWNQAKAIGVHFSFLSLGGGIPTQNLKKIPTIEEIGEVVNKILDKNFKVHGGKLRLTIEPGRGLVGDAALIGTRVEGMAKRGNEDWVWIDVGVFNGLMETIQNISYELKTEKQGRRKLVTVAGPSCDSVDIPFKNVMLGEVNTGDRVYIMNAGAYTTAYAANFNGFDKPEVYFINE